MEGKCPELVNFGTWYNVKVVVEENLDTSSIYVNEHLMTYSQKMRLPYHIGGGIVVLNGYNNTIYFKHLEIVSEAGKNSENQVNSH